MKATRKTPTERLTAGLERKPNGCLEWTGNLGRGGYGSIKVHGKTISTHRFAWTVVNGPIPDGFHVLHHCDNPPCCDTDKCLFLGTRADNMADKITKGRDYWQQKTHCPQNHPYDEANTYLYHGHRHCRICRAAAVVAHDEKKRRLARVEAAEHRPQPATLAPSAGA